MGNQEVSYREYSLVVSHSQSLSIMSSGYFSKKPNLLSHLFESSEFVLRSLAFFKLSYLEGASVLLFYFFFLNTLAELFEIFVNFKSFWDKSVPVIGLDVLASSLAELSLPHFVASERRIPFCSICVFLDCSCEIFLFKLGH